VPATARAPAARRPNDAAAIDPHRPTRNVWRRRRTPGRRPPSRRRRRQILTPPLCQCTPPSFFPRPALSPAPRPPPRGKARGGAAAPPACGPPPGGFGAPILTRFPPPPPSQPPAPAPRAAPLSGAPAAAADTIQGPRGGRRCEKKRPRKANTSRPPSRLAVPPPGVVVPRGARHPPPRLPDYTPPRPATKGRGDVRRPSRGGLGPARQNSATPAVVPRRRRRRRGPRPPNAAAAAAAAQALYPCPPAPRTPVRRRHSTLYPPSRLHQAQRKEARAQAGARGARRPVARLRAPPPPARARVSRRTPHPEASPLCLAPVPGRPGPARRRRCHCRRLSLAPRSAARSPPLAPAAAADSPPMQALTPIFCIGYGEGGKLTGRAAPPIASPAGAADAGPRAFRCCSGGPPPRRGGAGARRNEWARGRGGGRGGGGGVGARSGGGGMESTGQRRSRGLCWAAPGPRWVHQPRGRATDAPCGAPPRGSPGGTRLCSQNFFPVARGPFRRLHTRTWTGQTAPRSPDPLPSPARERKTHHRCPRIAPRCPREARRPAAASRAAVPPRRRRRRRARAHVVRAPRRRASRLPPWRSS
jgi:hypothetical protein